MNTNNESTPIFITVLFVILLILSFVFMISMITEAQTPEIDSLKKEYSKAYHIYDSCFKASKKAMVKKDCTEFWDNQVRIRSALKKCQILDEIIEHKIELWMDKRDIELQSPTIRKS